MQDETDLDFDGRCPLRAPNRLALALFLGTTAVSAQNLYPNPDFDDVEGTTGWQANPGSVGLEDADASDCPASGSLEAVTEKTLPQTHSFEVLGPCLAFDEEATVDVSFRYRGGPCVACELFVELGVYPNDTCLGFPFRNLYDYFTWLPDWTLLQGTFVVPAGGAIGMRASGGAASIATLQFDEIRVTAPGYLFLDGFDGGGTCRWSSSME